MNIIGSVLCRCSSESDVVQMPVPYACTVPRADIGFTEAFHEQEIYILHAGERIIYIIYCVTNTIRSVISTDDL